MVLLADELGGAWALLRRRDAEVPADLSGQDVGYLRVAGDRRGVAGGGVVVDRVVRALPPELAALVVEVPQELSALQRARGSRITSLPSASRWASSRRTSRSILVASRIISRASSRVLP